MARPWSDFPEGLEAVEEIARTGRFRLDQIGMILPGMAIISELIPTFSRKTIFGYRAIAYASVSLALVSFIVWGHHMFVAGQSQLATVMFSALTFLVAIPSGVKVFNWLGDHVQGQHLA